METSQDDYHCTKDNNGNYVDPITFDVIPNHRVVKTEGYCFDVKTLYISYVKTGKLDNPYTRQILPWKIRRDIRVYGEVQKIEVTFQGKTFLADSFAQLGRVLINVLSELEMKDSILSKDFVIVGDSSIYNHDLDMPLEEMLIEDNEIVIEEKGVATVEMLTKMKSFLQGEGENSNIRLIDLINAKIRLMSTNLVQPVAATARPIPAYPAPTTTTTTTPATGFRERRTGETVPHYLHEKYPNTRAITDPLTYYRNEVKYTGTDMTRLLSSVIANDRLTNDQKERALQSAMWLGTGLKITPDIFERISRVDAAGDARIRNTKNKLLNNALSEYGWPMRKTDGSVLSLSSLSRVTQNLVEKHPKWIAWRARNPAM